MKPDSRPRVLARPAAAAAGGRVDAVQAQRERTVLTATARRVTGGAFPLRPTPIELAARRVSDADIGSRTCPRALRELMWFLRSDASSLRVLPRLERRFFSGWVPRRWSRSVWYALEAIGQRRLGYALLHDLAHRPHTPVLIRPTASPHGHHVNLPAVYRSRALCAIGGVPGSGAPVTVRYSLRQHDASLRVLGVPDADPGHAGVERRVIPLPPWMALAHELVHAWRAQRGLLRAPTEPFGDAALMALWGTAEEFMTIAGPGEFTENRLRAAFALPARYGHEGFDTASGPRVGSMWCQPAGWRASVSLARARDAA